MLFPYLIKVSLLLAALTLGYRWLIQFETFSRVNRVLLWLNVAAAWLLPLIPLAHWGPVKVQQELHQSLPALVKVAPIPIKQLAAPITSLPAFMELSHVWSVSNWLMLFYLVGVLCMAGRFMMQAGGLILSLYKAPAEPLEAGIRLVRDTSTTSPYSFFRWIVCNPDNHAPQDLQQILAHESEHVRQWHSADLLLAELQRIALWFNPFSWVHQRLVQGNLEYLADRAVLDGGYERKQYQLNLLKTVLQTNELPLTNSFAQSLLKKRIKMMNRKPSSHWVWGKYMLLLSVLYLSSAFVAPYKQKLVEIAPEAMKPLVSALVAEEPVIKMETIEIKEELPQKQESTEHNESYPIDADTVKNQPQKWVLVKGDTLFWAVPARATLGVLANIQAEISNFGSEMVISSFKYDPLNFFITSIKVEIKTKGGSGSIGDENSGYTPVKGFSGFIIKSGNLGTGQLPPDPLYSQLKQEYSEALTLKKKNSSTYARDSLEQVLKKDGGSYGSSTYLKKYLEGSYAPTILQEQGIGKSENNTLLITVLMKDADFMLDGLPSTFERLNQLPFEQLDHVTILKTQNGKKFISVFSK
jgi:beta-lactamase regulating signal transducer with metallopeptidase domain